MCRDWRGYCQSTQDRRDELIGLSIEDKQGMVHAGPVVAVVIGSLLFAVSGVVCCIEVQQDARRHAVFGAPTDVELPQSPSHAQTISSCGCIFEPRDRWLTRKIGLRLGQASQHQLQQRVATQSVGIVLVLITACYLVDPLTHQSL